MNVFHIYYQNTQGTLMRILNAASRRGIDMPFVQAEPAACGHRVTLLLAVSARQLGQLCRDWYAIIDVADVRAEAASEDMASMISTWLPAPHPPVPAVSRELATRAAMA